ncbi:MAG: hypothetical protein KGN79_01855 [Acidobacteriota bacterium]|nr:hypothetical protein [Acidobacteriota bacterium]
MDLALIGQAASKDSLNWLDRILCAGMALFCAWNVVNGYWTGNIELHLATIRRSDMPPVFWFGMVFNCVLGVMLIIWVLTGVARW